MMGQQQTTTMTVATEKEAASALRRMVLALTVAAVMAVLMVAPAAPAFAKATGFQGTGNAGHSEGALAPGQVKKIPTPPPSPPCDIITDPTCPI